MKNYIYNTINKIIDCQINNKTTLTIHINKVNKKQQIPKTVNFTFISTN
ncbi:hypothetical protein SAMN05421818_10798 [Myroides phaeus]|uniref:Uncharacterized protein n=1 Tax=Myroides phaeus TaxID=702745 RepID=A0A1G8DMG4_9FLAO|nr:hypothetical protein SAMN05421818_10798 [Myroides phaeus]